MRSAALGLLAVSTNQWAQMRDPRKSYYKVHKRSTLYESRAPFLRSPESVSWMEVVRVRGEVSWRAGVVTGSERFMSPRHQKKEELYAALKGPSSWLTHVNTSGKQPRQSRGPAD